MQITLSVRLVRPCTKRVAGFFCSLVITLLLTTWEMLMMMAVLVNVYFNNDYGYGGDDDGLGYNAGKFKFWMTRG